jgi:crotonobetainyl-CoA:carnitine CoA-transferase CaiB-like acyl-CoA transferase
VRFEMPGPLEGIKVVELGLWVAGPSASAILCDWGAEVIKIEPPQGDPFRGWMVSMVGATLATNPPFELDNRGKRSVAINLENEEGRTIVGRLTGEADVLVTNMRPRVLDRYGLSYEELRETNPRLVYCQITGYGLEGPDRDRAAYDVGAFWARAGVAAALTPAGHEIPQQRGGMGDHMAGNGAAGAVCAALLARERSGQGQKVHVSLLRMGTYMMGWDLSLALRLNIPVVPYERRRSINPLLTCYRSGDDRWFWLLLLQADRHWADLCRAIDREDLLNDERFADIVKRRANTQAMVEELDGAFAGRSLEEWGKRFDEQNVWWAPVLNVFDVVHDPVAQRAGVLVEVEGAEGPTTMVASPADFLGTPQAPQGSAPELGQHTEEVLLELGYDWDEIVALKERGAIP